MKSHSTFVVGLTGGIGAGKSTVTSYLQKQGIPVFDCDKQVAIQYQDREFVEQLESKFGPLGSDPKARMAEKVVANPDLMEELAPLFDERIASAIKAFCIRNQWDMKAPFVVLDAPVLFEHNMDGLCNLIITISVPETIRRSRVILRPGMTNSKLDMILSKQWTDIQREEKSHFVIHNTGTIADVHRRVDEILGDIQRKIDDVA